MSSDEYVNVEPQDGLTNDSSSMSPDAGLSFILLRDRDGILSTNIEIRQMRIDEQRERLRLLLEP